MNSFVLSTELVFPMSYVLFLPAEDVRGELTMVRTRVPRLLETQEVQGNLLGN